MGFSVSSIYSGLSLDRLGRRTPWSVVLAVVLLYPVSPLHSQDKVRIGVTNPNMTFLPAGVALKKGFFQEEGLEAEVISMRTSTMITAITSGDIDYTMAFGSVIRAAVTGLPLRVVAGTMDSSTHTLVARPEFKSVKDLSGKVLGIESYGSTSDVAARMMLKHFAIDPEKEMRIVALGSAGARLAAMKAGLVHVVVVTPPADSEGKKMGFNIIARAHELFSFPFSGLGTNIRKIKERPEEVKRVIKAVIKALRFMRENRAGAIQVLVEWGRVEPEHAAASYDSTIKVFNSDGSIPVDGLRLLVEQAKVASKVTREVALSEVSYLTILSDAQRELGIKGR